MPKTYVKLVKQRELDEPPSVILLNDDPKYRLLLHDNEFYVYINPTLDADHLNLRSFIEAFVVHVESARKTVDELFKDKGVTE